MCGRFSLFADRDDVVAQFHVDDVLADGQQPRYNVAPSQPVLAVASSATGARRRLGTFRWGLVPHWAKDPSIGNRMINARVETAGSAPSFRAAFERRRCLIPASGYYEWKAPGGSHGAGSGASGGSGGSGGGSRPRKIPYYFRRRDGLLLAMGGLWEVWHGPDGEVLRTCTILTTDANGTNAPIHDRMPLIVPRRRWDEWLAPTPLAVEARAEVLAPVPDDLLVVEQVSDRVNDPRNDSPDLIEAVEVGGG
jgi:putative SOS response-associated peptidase YedK